MYKNFALLSIGGALLFSLSFFDESHAFQIDRNQNAGIVMAGDMKGTANLPITQVSNAPTPCGGRTGASCRQQNQQGTVAAATDGSLYTSASMLELLPAAGILFGAGLIVLIGLGASRLRHHHGHHA